MSRLQYAVGLLMDQGGTTDEVHVIVGPHLYIPTFLIIAESPDIQRCKFETSDVQLFGHLEQLNVCFFISFLLSLTFIGVHPNFMATLVTMVNVNAC